MKVESQALRVLHIISGDLWAGAEAQAYTLLKHLKSSVGLHVVLMNDGELASRLRQLDIPVTVLPETQLSSFAIIKQLVVLIRDFKPNVIHTHRQKENILGNLANFIAFPFFKNRPKSLRTAHGAPESTPKGKQKIQVWLDRWIGSYLQQAVIAVSDDLAKKLLASFPAQHIHVVHNGVDRDTLLESTVAANFKLEWPDHKHIGIIGRLEPVKRIDLFLEMAVLMLNSPPLDYFPVLFHIIGDGGLREAMEQKAELLGIADRVKFHGHRADIASCILSLDVVVMCSDHEGTPMTALETLALGKPLVAHDVGGLHELLSGQAHLLVLEHNPLGYATAISKLLAHSHVKPHLAPCYTADTNMQNTLALYKKVVANLQ